MAFRRVSLANVLMWSGVRPAKRATTSKKPAVATGYAVRKSKTNEALLMKIVSKNQLQRGADVSWLSMFPGEDEVLWSPLTFMQPTGREQVIEHDGFKVNINEVECVLGDA